MSREPSFKLTQRVPPTFTVTIVISEDQNLLEVCGGTFEPRPEAP